MGIREKTEEKVFSYMERYRMVEAGDRIAAGVSGGADSLCLLFLLLEYARKTPFCLGVVHVNHNIRPDAAEDTRYVEELCRQQGIPFFLTEADVPGLVKEKKCSWEEAGRKVRYEAFSRAAESMGGGKIAVAHNSNDNAETMLFHLFRGSGLKGLCGIRPVRDRIIRPLLCLEREEVEAYLRDRGIAWRNDSTNEEDDYRRNRIRHHILPYAEREIVSGAVGHMSGSAEMLGETEEYLEMQTGEALRQCMAEPEAFENGKAGAVPSAEGRILNVEAFLSFHPVLRKRMLHRLVRELSPGGKDIRRVHIEDTLSLFEREGNRQIMLPFGIRAERQYGIVVIKRNGFSGTEKKAGMQSNPGEEVSPEEEGMLTEQGISGEEGVSGEEKTYGEEGSSKEEGSSGEESTSGGRGKSGSWREYPVKVKPKEGDFLVYDLGKAGKIEFTLFSKKKWMKIPENRYTKWFDCDKIEESMVIRSRRAGDYLTIARQDGSMAHKSLKAYMTGEKIPRQLREEIPVLAAGSHVLWLAGWRISEYFKVREDTKRILQVRLAGKEDGNCRSSETEEKDVGTH